MSRVRVFSAEHVYAAVSPDRALQAVREAFIAYARGDWTMPPKVYVPAYPAGDFRAMPALGAGHALLKWVTSFPGNPAKGLPTVMGLVLLSDASNGSLGAVLAGNAQGRQSDEEITTFDSTGLAIQDLAIALAAMERSHELDLPTLEL